MEKEAVKCSECGKFFNKEFGMCPFCGTELVEGNIETIDNQDALLSVLCILQTCKLILILLNRKK